MELCAFAFEKKVANWQGLVFLEWFEAQESRKVCVEQLEKQAAGLTARGCRAGEDVKSRLGKGTLHPSTHLERIITCSGYANRPMP